MKRVGQVKHRLTSTGAWRFGWDATESHRTWRRASGRRGSSLALVADFHTPQGILMAREDGCVEWPRAF